MSRRHMFGSYMIFVVMGLNFAFETKKKKKNSLPTSKSSILDTMPGMRGCFAAYN